MRPPTRIAAHDSAAAGPPTGAARGCPAPRQRLACAGGRARAAGGAAGGGEGGSGGGRWLGGVPLRSSNGSSPQASDAHDAAPFVLSERSAPSSSSLGGSVASRSSATRSSQPVALFTSSAETSGCTPVTVYWCVSGL